jgi:hypothetical protein
MNLQYSDIHALYTPRFFICVLVCALTVLCVDKARANAPLFFRIVAEEEARITTLVVEGGQASLSWQFTAPSDRQQLQYCTDLVGHSSWQLLWDADETCLNNDVAFDLPATNIDLSNGLFAFYRLNGDGMDQTTNTLHGNVSGALATSNRYGRVSRALRFDGVDDAINLGLPILETISGDHEMTLAAWIYPLNVTEDRWVLCQYIADIGQTGRFTWGLQNGRIRYFRGGTSVFSDTELTPNQWHHIATTKDRFGTITHYVNGQFAGTGSAQGAFTTIATRIGGGVYSSQSYVFSGAIDDLRVFRRTLSAEAIRRIHLCR